MALHSTVRRGTARREYLVAWWPGRWTWRGEQLAEKRLDAVLHADVRIEHARAVQQADSANEDPKDVSVEGGRGAGRQQAE